MPRGRGVTKSPRCETPIGGPAKCHPDRPCWAKGLCCQCWGKQYRAKNKDSINSYLREYRKTHKEEERVSAQSRRYKLPKGTIRDIKASQGGLCAICRDKEALHLDHNHDTWQVRGLLCSTCNTGLGCFKENPRLFLAALEYLKQWKDAPGSLPPGVIFVPPPPLPTDEAATPEKFIEESFPLTAP